MRDLLQNNLVGGKRWTGWWERWKKLALSSWLMKLGDGYDSLNHSLLLYVFENNIKLKIKRNIVSMPFLFQRNPLSGEISSNLVTGEYLGA